MLSKTEAIELVSEKLRQMSAHSDPFVLVDEDTIERPFGWVFFYNSKKYRDTGEFKYRLAGNGPIILNKYDRTIHFCATYKAIEESIADYERGLANKM